MCVLHFLSFQILFLADSAWPPASFSWNSLKTFSFISTRSRLVLLSAHIESLAVESQYYYLYYSGKKKRKKKTLTHTLGEKCHFRWQVVLYIYSCVCVFFFSSMIRTTNTRLTLVLFLDTWALVLFVLFFFRVTSTTMIHSTSTMLRQKQRLATTERQKRYANWAAICMCLWINCWPFSFYGF